MDQTAIKIMLLGISTIFQPTSMFAKMCNSLHIFANMGVITTVPSAYSYLEQELWVSSETGSEILEVTIIFLTDNLVLKILITPA